MIIFFLLLNIIWYSIITILRTIAYWRIFKKAGEKSWKVLIPFYNIYIVFKIPKGLKLLVITLIWLCLTIAFISFMIALRYFNLLPESDSFYYNIMGILMFILYSVAPFIIHLIYCVKLAKAFGKGVGHTFGLIFLNTIFLLILAFGNSKYEYLLDDKSSQC